MRVRVALRALNAIKDMRHLLNPFRYGVFTWQLLSHKVLRYGSFTFFIGVFVLNFPMVSQGIVLELLLFVQCLFYVAALSGWCLAKRGGLSGVFSGAFYFCLVHVAAAEAAGRMLLGQNTTIWVPREGAASTPSHSK